LREISRGQGVPLVDARDWAPLEDFVEGVHLTHDGAAAFTERFGREVLESYLDGGPPGRLTAGPRLIGAVRPLGSCFAVTWPPIRFSTSTRSALSATNCVHGAGTLLSWKIASTGHSGTHASQSMQLSGSMKSWASSW